jgi:membrane-associated phospholipid phosphatase
MLAAAQRVFASAHYPSDVLFGTALGMAGAATLLGGVATPRAGAARLP